MASSSSTEHNINSTVVCIHDSDVWGIVIKDEGSVLRLDSGRIVKKSTYKTEWCYEEELSHIYYTVIGMNDSKVWGIPTRYEGKVIRLDSGLIVQKNTYGLEWCYFGELKYIKKTFKEVAEKNSLISYRINLEKPLHHFNLYLLRIMDDCYFSRVDHQKIHEVREMVVSARDPEEAKTLASTCKNLDDSEAYWKEPRYILCELIGESYKDETKIISVSRYDDNFTGW